VWNWDDRPGSQLAGGSGYGGDFVRSMKAGDRVSVVARAMVGIHQLDSRILFQEVLTVLVSGLGESCAEDGDRHLLRCLDNVYLLLVVNIEDYLFDVPFSPPVPVQKLR
jgi:hypothetical protein